MPKMPAKSAPSAAEKVAMDSRSSSRLTWRSKRQAGCTFRLGGADESTQGQHCVGMCNNQPDAPPSFPTSPSLPTSNRRAERDTPMDSSRSRAPSSSRSASDCQRGAMRGGAHQTVMLSHASDSAPGAAICVRL